MNVGDEILRYLYEHGEEETCHNDLRRAPFSPNSLKKYVGSRKEKGELIKQGFITAEDVKLKRIYNLTSKGIARAQCERFMKRFVRFVDAHKGKEQLKMLTQLFKDLFECAHENFLTGKIESFRVLFDSLSMSIMDELNKEWLWKKDDMLKRSEITGVYVFPEFKSNDKRSLAFIEGDGELAWVRGDYLSTNHRYVLEKLNRHSKEDMEKRNSEWLKKHGGQHSNPLVLKELQERVEKIKGMIKSLHSIPEEGLPYPSGKTPYKTISNWMINLPKDYGDSIWDTR